MVNNMFKHYIIRNLSIPLLAISSAQIAHAQCDLEIQPTDPPAKIIEGLRCLSSENQQIKSELKMLQAKADSAEKAAQASEKAAQDALGHIQDLSEKLDRMWKRSITY